MKKTAIILFAVFASLSLNAKIWLGGELGLKTSKTSNASYTLNSSTSVEISPEIGKYINDKWAMGIRLGYAHHDNAEIEFIDTKVFGKSDQIRFSPFVRYTYYSTGNFRFYVDGGVGYSALFQEEEKPLHNVGIFLQPGLSYAINDKVGLTGHLGSIGYEHYWMKRNGTTLTNNTFNLNIFGGVSFGIYVNF